MKIYWPCIIYILFLSLNSIFSIEYLKKFGTVQIICQNNNFLIFDSSSFPIPSTIHFKFSIESNSSFDKIISFEFDLIETNNEFTETNNNELIETNKKLSETNNQLTEKNNGITELINGFTEINNEINYTIYSVNENYGEKNSEITLDNSFIISNKRINKNNTENANQKYIEQNHKFRYVIYPSGESEENIKNIKYNLTYFNIDKNQARVGHKFGNNLLISFNCKGILKIENTKNDLSSGLSIKVLIIIIAGGLLVIIIIVVLLVFYFKKNMGKKDDKKLIKNKTTKKTKNENKEMSQISNNGNNKYRKSLNLNRHGFLSKQRFQRLSIQNSTNSSVLRIKKRKKKS